MGDIMKMNDIVKRAIPPLPWAEGDNIPWNEPGFSRRMLREHLSQDHDAASRKLETIDRHIDWIHSEVLHGKESKILDLGCGPGFYTQRLAELGHKCRGIDYSPASIDYAKQQANKSSLKIEYVWGDIRKADYGSDFDLITQIYGEINVFSTQNAKLILRKVHSALKDNGILIFEPQTLESLKESCKQPPSWYSFESGLFSDHPHLWLQENFWDENNKIKTMRFYCVETETSKTTSFAASYQTYTDLEYVQLLESSGFKNIHKFPSLTGREEDSIKEFVVYSARKA